MLYCCNIFYNFAPKVKNYYLGLLQLPENRMKSIALIEKDDSMREEMKST